MTKNKRRLSRSEWAGVVRTHSLGLTHLGDAMPFESELYPPEWRATRQAKLKAANYRCEECGVRDRTIQLNRNQEPYIVYLSIAHKKQYQTWMKDAETMVLCQRCHRRYDRQFRRKAGARTHAPIGYIKVFVTRENGGEVLAEYARTYDELRVVVSSLPEQTDFTCLAEINGAVVGNGAYTKVNNDKIILHNEYGAGVGLHPQLYPIGRIRK